MSKTLLIVEEALKNLEGHWFEYIKTISQYAKSQGDQVDVACHYNATPEVQRDLNTFNIFRYARYLDGNNSPGDRYYGFVLHSWRSLLALWPLLSQQPRYDKALAPTVLVHHLLAWWIIMRLHPKAPQQLTLFFLTSPGVWNPDTRQSVVPFSIHTKIQSWLLQRFERLVKTGRVRLAVDTRGNQREFELISNLPVTLMTHPVPALEIATDKPSLKKTLNFACYGFARYEKGSDLFKSAIEEILIKQPSFAGRFIIQWIDPFDLPTGAQCSAKTLQAYSQVDVIDRPLESDGYQQQLRTVDCMVLPYRNSAYYARVSRTAVESAYLGIPMIYTRGGWLEDTVEAFGAGIGIQDESASELVNAIEKMTAEYDAYRQAALNSVKKAKRYFSVAYFYQQLLQEP